MAERGPLPKPNPRRRNKRPTSGKSIEVARPVMPKTLSEEAKAEWRRIVPELEDMGLIARTDRALLVRYCTVWADWCELNENLQKTGKLIKGRMGNNSLVRNPLWLMRSDAEATLSDLMKQLVLSPNSRLRAAVAHEKPAEDEPETGPTALDEYRKRLAK